MQNEKNELVFQTCLLLVRYFTNLVEYEKSTGTRIGYHSRIFDPLLHPQEQFIFLGKSEKLLNGVQSRIEHVVPCAYMTKKLEGLIKENKYTEEELAHALQKNWKVAHITKEEADFMDFDLKLKSTMPEDWDFMTGRPEIRLEAAGIKLIP
jgi:identified by metaGeneAnnotator